MIASGDRGKDTTRHNTLVPLYEYRVSILVSSRDEMIMTHYDVPGTIPLYKGTVCIVLYCIVSIHGKKHSKGIEARKQVTR